MVSANESQTDTSQGGIAFFMLFFFLCVASLGNLKYMPLLWDEVSKKNISFGILGLTFGFVVGSLLYRGYCKSLIHELKHCIIALLVGNSIKNFQLQSNEGQVTYEFYNTTKKFNAFILLAPYTLPLFSFPLFLLVLTLSESAHQQQLLFIAFAFGIDLFCNFRDATPAQTDLTNIKGGYPVGFVFVLASNTLLFTLLSAWSLHGLDGIVDLFQYSLTGLTSLVRQMVNT